jgi:selenocysteine lyase/cysteine desulfurase
VAVSERDDAVRVSPHGWNTADDVDALLDAAAELLA